MRLKVFLLPLDEMLVHRRSLPHSLLGFPNNLPEPIYTPGWRDCLHSERKTGETRRQGWGRNREDSRAFFLFTPATQANISNTVDPWSLTVTVVVAVWRGFTYLLHLVQFAIIVELSNWREERSTYVRTCSQH